MKSPLVSIITATFNSEQYIQECINAVLNQSYQPLEHIFIDGGSKDNTIQIIEASKKSYEHKGIILHYLSEKDSGIFDAWNKGLKIAQGKWISFLGSDDRYVPNAIENLIKQGELDKNPDFITAKAEIRSNGKPRRIHGEEWKWNRFNKEMKVLHAGGLHNSLYFEQFGQFKTEFKVAGDYELLLRKGAALKVSFVDEILVIMGGEGVSSVQIFNSLNEARKAKFLHTDKSAVLLYIEMYFVLAKIKLKELIRFFYPS